MIALNPYAHYRQPEQPWLPNIPEHWDVRRAKYLMEERDVRWTSETGRLLSVSQYTGVTDRRRKQDTDEPDSRAATLLGYKVAEPEDLVVNIMLAWNGSFGVADVEGVVSPAYCVYRFTNNNPWYFHFLLRTGVYKAEIRRRSTGIVDSRLRLYTDDLFAIPLLVPPRVEQDRIVSFLRDLKRTIDALLLNKRQVQALLVNQRLAVIDELVVGGLDSKAAKKDSVLEWIGSVPAHWREVRLRYLTAFVTSGSRGWSQYAAETGSLFLRIGNLSRGTLDLDLRKPIRIALPDNLGEARRSRVQAGDILLSITAYIGSVAVVPEDGGEAYVSQHVALCRPDATVHNSTWLGYSLLSTVGRGHGQLSLYGGTKDGLSLDDVKNYPVLMPPAEEQDALVRAIDSRTATIDRAIDRVRRQIELLKEYEVSLSASVVLGQVDVALAAVQLSERVQSLDVAEPLDLAEDELLERSLV